MKTRILNFKKWVLFIHSLALSMLIIFGQTIIDDHTVISKYGDIPQQYIDSLKKYGKIHLGSHIHCDFGMGAGY